MSIALIVPISLPWEVEEDADERHVDQRWANADGQTTLIVALKLFRRYANVLRSRRNVVIREHASLKKIHPKKMYKHARSTNGLLKDPFAQFCETRSIRSNNIHLRPPTEATNAPSKNLRSFVH
ncbi:unnamed protein product [Bursaphelenchus xylophilus]|uniref:(pine wood nematode) hypothetical protein n=1 Tax=Bursaphelenchus xylophilus TaxID=6326 RepID=A0A811M1H5_BURXY|nr:unnamed protein product [Bursaphelenchus xylophilus]CAG9126526.1 unnamed protein product [Bursaphelenchus xylophilus]